MANQQHLDVLRKGVETWNQWRQEHLDIEPDLNEANLSKQSLERADLSRAHLKNANLKGVRLEKVNLSTAHLEDADLSEAYLEGADLRVAYLAKARLNKAFLKGAKLDGASLEGASLEGASLEGASLDRAHLGGASLKQAHFEAASLEEAHLEGADLTEAFFSNTTRLHKVTLSDEEYGSVSLADICWQGANLAVVDWSTVKVLGEEQTALQTKTPNGAKKYRPMRIDEYRTAVRANRQLVEVLRGQGLNEEADYFAYRAQVLQKTVFRLQMLDHQAAIRGRIRMLALWLSSWFRFLIAGYGYSLDRSFFSYLFVISFFAMFYYVLGQTLCPPLSLLGAFVFSMTSFHGRGFFPGSNIPIDSPLTVLAALEAFVGLLIEVTFIATLTQRFFGK